MRKLQRWAIGTALVLVALVAGMFAVTTAVVAFGFYTYTVLGVVGALALMIFAAWPWIRRGGGKNVSALSVMVLAALVLPVAAQAGVNWGSPNDFYKQNAWMNVWEEVSNPDTSTAAKCHVYGQAFWGGDWQIDAVNRDFYCNAKGPWTVSTKLTKKSGYVHNCHNHKNACWTGHAEWEVKVDYWSGPSYTCSIFATARIYANTNGPWYDYWNNGGGGALGGGVC